MAHATRIVFVTGEAATGKTMLCKRLAGSANVHIFDASLGRVITADNIVERATAAAAAGANTVVVVHNKAPPANFAQCVEEHGMLPFLAVFVKGPADVATAAKHAAIIAGGAGWSVVHRTDEASSSWTSAAGTAPVSWARGAVVV